MSSRRGRRLPGMTTHTLSTHTLSLPDTDLVHDVRGHLA